MDPHRPPKKRGSRAQLREPFKAPDQSNFGASVQHARFFRNGLVRVRYCLEPDIWAWLAWEAAGNTGGWEP